MFAWNCAEAGGQHLGTCVDRFYFGSCCKLPDVISSNELGGNEGLLEDKPSPDENIAAPATTAKPSTTSIAAPSISTTTKSTSTTTVTTLAPSSTSTVKQQTPPPISVTASISLGGAEIITSSAEDTTTTTRNEISSEETTESTDIEAESVAADTVTVNIGDNSTTEKVAPADNLDADISAGVADIDNAVDSIELVAENIAESVADTVLEITEDLIEEPEAPFSEVLKPIVENDIQTFIETTEEDMSDPWSRQMTVAKVESLLKNSTYPEGSKKTPCSRVDKR